MHALMNSQAKLTVIYQHQLRSYPDEIPLKSTQLLQIVPEIRPYFPTAASIGQKTKGVVTIWHEGDQIPPEMIELCSRFRSSAYQVETVVMKAEDEECWEYCASTTKQCAPSEKTEAQRNYDERVESSLTSEIVVNWFANNLPEFSDCSAPFECLKILKPFWEVNMIQTPRTWTFTKTAEGTKVITVALDMQHPPTCQVYFRGVSLRTTKFVEEKGWKLCCSVPGTKSYRPVLCGAKVQCEKGKRVATLKKRPLCDESKPPKVQKPSDYSGSWANTYSTTPFLVA
eukprot:TRINITY_DN1507_c0_g1_i1.p1 TRINITY_DN1507_c0_g1~~TRINITY_DN1507_c0_g1_i1.p1  ORF type:complete len:292 (-),score=17.20 TRINITY_DN1507_c0_g1_i1:117-971(-)